MVFCKLVSLGIYQNLSIGHDLFLATGGNNTEISPFKSGVFGRLLDLALPFSRTYLHIALVYLVVDFFHPHAATSSGFSISMCEISLKTSGSLRETVIFHVLRRCVILSFIHLMNSEFNNHGEKVTT